MNTLSIARDALAEFKSGVDTLLEKRKYFTSRILPLLVEGQDFYTVRGKRSLGKGGAEKIASIYRFTASFKRDNETLEALANPDWVAFVCQLWRDGKVVGEGRGAASVKKNDGDINKAIKMSLKSSYIDSVIRSTGISDIFTQDICPEAIQPSGAVMSPEEAEESLSDDHYSPAPEAPVAQEGEYEEENGAEPPISERQRQYLYDLVSQHLPDGEEKERYTASIDGMTKSDASDAIKGMLAMAGR